MSSTPAIVAATGITLANSALLRAGLRPRIDGWRRAAGLVLRGEASTFVLSALGLDIWSGGPHPTEPSLAESRDRFAQRLHSFLAIETSSHVRIRRGEHEDVAERADGPCYTLAVHRWVDGPERFIRPDDWSGDPHSWPESDSASAPLFNAVVRIDTRGSADLWIRVNHVGADGVPMQDMLTRLESAWGGCDATRYPTPEEFGPLIAPRPSAGRDGLAEVQAFIDFSSLLAWRKAEIARLGEPMTVAAAILWRLAGHPAFVDLCAGTTVEVAANGDLAPGVGVVVVRPRDYAPRPDGLRSYVRDFNREIERTRRRASRSCRTLDAAALTPARHSASLLRHALVNSPRAFGAMALTMLKDARVFGAPIADVGHDRGFIAIGSVALPCADGRKVGCVTVKGPAAIIRDYPDAIASSMR